MIDNNYNLSYKAKQLFSVSGPTTYIQINEELG